MRHVILGIFVLLFVVVVLYFTFVPYITTEEQTWEPPTVDESQMEMIHESNTADMPKWEPRKMPRIPKKFVPEKPVRYIGFYPVETLC